MFTSYLLQREPSEIVRSENHQSQLFVKDPLSLMAKGQGENNTDQNSSTRSQNNPMMTSPMQIIQSQLGLTPQQLQVLMHHHQQQQQQQLAFQSVSIVKPKIMKRTRLITRAGLL